MQKALGFSLLELIVVMAIVAILTSLGYAGYQSVWEKSNFRTMQEFGVEVALSQQLHRQRYGRYAQNIASNGSPNANLLVVPSANKYQINISSADFRGFSALIQPHQNDPMRLPNECSVLVVESDLGFQRFGSKSAANQTTSDRCIPHG